LLKLKCPKFDFGLGSTPDPAGDLTVLSRLRSWISSSLILKTVTGKKDEVRRGEEKKGRRL